MDIPTPVALIGCGYAADFYLHCLKSYPHLDVVGVYDSNPERVRRTAEVHAVPPLSSFEELAYSSAAIVVNATSIGSHFPVSRDLLLAGKNVYSEKPVATSMTEGIQLVSLAESRGLLFAGAPSTVLSECYRTLKRAIDDGLIGRPLVVHAALEDGPVHRMNYANWVSRSGYQWPVSEEFTAGPLLEHAGYQLSWVLDLFGSVEEAVGRSSRLLSGTERSVDVLRMGVDSGHWSLRHGSGVITRLSGGSLAPRDYSLSVVGDEGTLSVPTVLRIDSPITYRRVRDHKTNDYLGEPVTLEYPTPEPTYRDDHYIDFGAGVNEMARCLASGQQHLLGGQRLLRLLELTLLVGTEQAGVTAPSTGRRFHLDLPVPDLAGVR